MRLAQRRVQLDGGAEDAAIEPQHAQRAGRADGRRRGASVEQRGLAERVARAEQVERDLLAVGVLDEHARGALGDHVERVGGVAGGDDGLAERVGDGDEGARPASTSPCSPVEQRQRG